MGKLRKKPTKTWTRLVVPRRIPTSEITWHIRTLKQKAENSISDEFCFGGVAAGWPSFLVYVGAYLGVVCRQGSQWLCSDIGSLGCVSQWHKGCHCVSQVISVSRPTLCYKLASVEWPIGSDFRLALSRMIAMPGQGLWNDILDLGRSLDVLLTRCNLPISNHLSNCAMV